MTPCAGDLRFTSDDPAERAAAVPICWACPLLATCCRDLTATPAHGVYAGVDYSEHEQPEVDAANRCRTCDAPLPAYSPRSDRHRPTWCSAACRLAGPSAGDRYAAAITDLRAGGVRPPRIADAIGVSATSITRALARAGHVELTAWLQPAVTAEVQVRRAKYRAARRAARQEAAA